MTLIAAGREVRRRRPYSGSDVAGLAKSPEIGTDTKVISYANTPELASVLARRGARLLGPPAPLKQQLDDKPFVRSYLESHSLQPAPGFVAGPAWTWRAVRRQLGSPFVAQARTGSTGRSTWLVCDDEGFNTARSAVRGAELLVSEWFPGTTLNLHGLVTDHGTHVGPPSMQLTGPPELTTERFAYCGADFGAASQLAPATLRSAASVAARTGDALLAMGWTGLFGVDLQLSDGRLHTLEINPRLQASSWLLAEVERAAGVIPLGRLHAEYLAGGAVSSRREAAVGPATSGAFMVLRQDPPGGRAREHPPPGVYRLDHGLLHYLRRDVGLRCCTAGECYVDGFGPAAGAWHETAATLARLTTHERLIELDGQTLTSAASALLDALCRLLGVTQRTGLRTG